MIAKTAVLGGAPKKVMTKACTLFRMRDMHVSRGCLLAMAIAMVSVAPLGGQPTLEARFIGNMAWSITDGAFTLMSDFPYDSGAVNGYMTYDTASELRSPTADTLSLITHRHADHWSPALFAKTNWRLVRHVTSPPALRPTGWCRWRCDFPMVRCASRPSKPRTPTSAITRMW